MSCGMEGYFSLFCEFRNSLKGQYHVILPLRLFNMNCYSTNKWLHLEKTYFFLNSIRLFLLKSVSNPAEKLFFLINWPNLNQTKKIF